VEFVASGTTEAQPHFQRGVAALHSFWYEEALAAFQRTLELDPNFAMAWWGIAMAYHRPYLPGSDDAAGRAALAHVSDTARLTRREAAYIDALRAYYADQPWAERTLAYASAMEKLHRTYPEDLNAAAFYSLSLLGYGWSTNDGFARQEQAAAVASEVYRRNPRHPGAAHYLIHSLDEPTLANRGLDAARHYATIAPDAPHALHMPSHIFLQLGLWREVSRSNEAAWIASENWVRSNHLGLEQRDYHNYHWLIYACLQQGRYARAGELAHAFEQMRGDISPESRHFLNDALASYVVETRDWQNADALFSTAQTPEISAGAKPARAVEFCGGGPENVAMQGADVPAFIRAFAAAAAGLPEADDRLAALRKAVTVNNTIARFWRIRILEVAAVGLARTGEFDDANKAILSATALEESSGPSPGPPSSFKPPHELAGEILLQCGRPGDAIAQFNKALERHPNRALALLGRARAEAALHTTAAAALTYARFLEVWSEADANRPELREAREFTSHKQSRDGE
jgi:tetratricopeptide (TPR) repeat protein